MKINNITLQERIFWIVGAGLIAFFAENQMKRVDDLHILLTTHEIESNIQEAQLLDFSQQLDIAIQAEYSKGFEDGKTQAGVALAQGDSLYNYTDGYHAALSQFNSAEITFHTKFANHDARNFNEDDLLNLLIKSLVDRNASQASYRNIAALIFAKDREPISESFNATITD
jgi:hypothetical protein